MSRKLNYTHANPRHAAAAMVDAVVNGGQSLGRLPPVPAAADGRDRALAMAIAYGTLREWPRLQWLMNQMLSQPLRGRARTLGAVIGIGLHQLAGMRVPAHAAVDETVRVARWLGGPKAGGLVNAILRRYQREQGEWQARVKRDPTARYACPGWWLDILRSDWPEHWAAVAEAGNAQAPMWLRVNRHKTSTADYAARLEAELGQTPVPHANAPDALRLLAAVDVDALPGFDEGLVSVQDAAAQLATSLLPLEPGVRVLDACAAPGGKSTHILERCPDARLTAIDIDETRLSAVSDSLTRLGQTGEVFCADAAEPDAWWDGEPYDAMLIDAPCTSSGVVRRHPDIKLLRRAEDIVGLGQRQAAMLNALWPLLRPGGTLVYATCSVFRAENADQVSAFVSAHDDAVPHETTARLGCGIDGPMGTQVLPGEDDMDGFYYACVSRKAGV